MSIQELDAEIAREDAAEARRAAREAARNGVTPTAVAPQSRATTTAVPRPAAMSFEVVAELPKAGTGRGNATKPVPAPRQQLIDYAIEHPGSWLRYLIGTDEPIKKVSTLGNYVKKHQGGFVAGFSYAVRSGQLFVRYDRPTS